jgi:viroplasmin and RNaseH domain-containing protein
MRWYAVRRGKVPGVYNSWRKCQEQLNGFTNNSYERYNTREEAEADYLQFLAGQTAETRNHGVVSNHGVASNHGVVESSRMKDFIILILLLVIMYLLFF